MPPQARRRKPVTDVVQYEPLKEAERLQRKDLTTIVTGILWSQSLPRWSDDSALLGYIDLTRGQQTENHGGIRPGCWVNAIPAGGLVLLADAASWCTCSYLNQATIALEPQRLP